MQNQWYIARDGKQYGPVTDGDLEQLVQKRELLDGDFLWRQGFETWLPVAQVPEIRNLSVQNTHPITEQPNVQNDSTHELPGVQADEPQHAQSFQPQQEMQPSYDQGQYQASVAQQNFAPHQEAAPSQHTAGIAPTPQAQANVNIDRATSPDLTNTSLSDVANQYPALHESEQRNYGQAQDVQDLVEETETDHFPKGKENHSELSFNPNQNMSANGAVQSQSQQITRQLGSSRGMASNDMPSVLSADQQHSSSEVGMRGNQLSATSPDQALNNYEQGEKRKLGFSWPLGLGIGVAAVFILLIGATFALPFIVPPETVKKQISNAIKEKTGRDVTFKGKISYRFFPSFGIDLNNIIIHNPPSIKGPNFLQLGRLQADLKILPLLSKKVEIGRIVMHRPEIALIKDGQGRVNYEFKNAGLPQKNFKAALLHSLGVKPELLPGTKQTSKSFRVAQSETLDTSDIIARTLEKLEQEEAANKKSDTPSKPTAKTDAKGPTVEDGELEDVKPAKLANNIIIGEIEIVNGAVKIIDQKKNSETMISAINLSVQAPALDKDVAANGTLRYLEDRITLTANLSTLSPLLNGEEVKTSLTMNSDRFEGKFDGKMRLRSSVEFAGDADIQTYSLQNLLSWLGVDVPKRGYGGAYIRGKLSGTPDVFQLGSATIKVDNTVLIGALRLRPNGTRPKIEAQLRTDLLDLSPYVAQQNNIKRGSVDGLAGPRKTAVAAWKSEKIDVSFLKNFDGTMQLTASRLIYQKHRLEKAKIGMKVNAGLLTAQLPSFNVYGGTGSLTLSLNSSKARPTLKGRIGLKQIKIKPLLKNSADLSWLSGVGNVDLDIISAGGTEQELISALNGTGKITITDGAIEGVNIPGMIRNLQKGKLSQPSGSPKEKTDFSDLNASFVISRGVIENKDLVMKGPLLRMTGSGILNLPAEQIDYGLRPKLVSSLNGQGGKSALSGINIPIRVKGPMANPKFIPDAKGLLENNGEAIENTVKSVKKVVKNLKKKKLSGEEMKGLLNGLIDGKEDSSKLLEGILQ